MRKDSANRSLSQHKSLSPEKKRRHVPHVPVVKYMPKTESQNSRVNFHPKARSSMQGNSNAVTSVYEPHDFATNPMGPPADLLSTN